MTVEERKASYENSALQRLMEASGKKMCERCWCCQTIWDDATCWQCGGFESEDEDDYECSVCHGEGEIDFEICIGNCDENGNHAPRSESGKKEEV